MQVELKQKHKTTDEELDKFKAAQKDFAKTMKQIEPFIKVPKKVTESASGEWITSELEQ